MCGDTDHTTSLHADEIAASAIESFSKSQFSTLEQLDESDLHALLWQARRAEWQDVCALSRRGRETAKRLQETIPFILDRRAEIESLNTVDDPDELTRLERLERERTGFVYLMIAEGHQYKIGRTAQPGERLQQIIRSTERHTDYVCLIPTVNTVKLEHELHKQYAAKRIQGEWFDLSSADVEQIKLLAARSQGTIYKTVKRHDAGKKETASVPMAQLGFFDGD